MRSSNEIQQVIELQFDFCIPLHTAQRSSSTPRFICHWCARGLLCQRPSTGSPAAAACAGGNGGSLRRSLTQGVFKLARTRRLRQDRLRGGRRAGGGPPAAAYAGAACAGGNGGSLRRSLSGLGADTAMMRDLGADSPLAPLTPNTSS